MIVVIIVIIVIILRIITVILVVMIRIIVIILIIRTIIIIMIIIIIITTQAPRRIVSSSARKKALMPAKEADATWPVPTDGGHSLLEACSGRFCGFGDAARSSGLTEFAFEALWLGAGVLSGFFGSKGLGLKPKGGAER